MKRSLWTMLAISMALTIILTACGTSHSVPPAPTTIPATPQTNNILSSVGNVVASAVAVPQQQAQLSLAISAPV